MSNNKTMHEKTKSDRLKIDIISAVLTGFFKFQILLTDIQKRNEKKLRPCIYALWHAHQFALHAVPDRDKLHVLISPSVDGEIVSRATNAVGISTVRGSYQRKGSTQATMELIEKLESGHNIALTIDGPKGPKRVCKPGIVSIAKLSGAPIVPIIWYSKFPNFLKFKISWDDLRCPFLPCKTMLFHGEPIYVPSDITDEELETYRLKVENSLLDLYKDAQDNFWSYLK